MRGRALRIGTLVLAAWLAIGGVRMQGQVAARTVLDGVYTEAQAARGEDLYDRRCARCHDGADVDGPTLLGDPFIDRWREDALDRLFTYIATQMPRDAPGSLGEAASADILAHLLKRHLYPAGAGELTPAATAQIQLVGLSGPKPLPTNAMVLAVGCFAAGPNNTYVLTRSSEPSRARVADETSDAELRASAARALGAHAFRLQNLDMRPGFTAAAFLGKKVQVKGVVIRQTNNDRINVLLIATVPGDCAQP